MIEVMKKVTVLAAARDREVTLERLRRVAVLHLEPHRPPRTDEMERLRGEAGELASALLLLGEDGVRGGWLPDGDGVRIARRLLDLAEIHRQGKMGPGPAFVQQTHGLGDDTGLLMGVIGGNQQDS